MGHPAPPIQGVRLYRTARSQQIYGVLILIVAGFGIFFQERSWSLDLPNIGVLVVLAAFALRFAAVLSKQLRLSEDAVEVSTIFRRKRLRFDQIRGRREYIVYGRYGASRRLKIEPNNDHLPTIKFDRSDSLDDAFYGWFNNLPNLDANEKVAQGGGRT